MGGGGVNTPPARTAGFFSFEPFFPRKVGDGFFSPASARRKSSIRRSAAPLLRRPLGRENPSALAAAILPQETFS
jgi:hypothetical protein